MKKFIFSIFLAVHGDKGCDRTRLREGRAGRSLTFSVTCLLVTLLEIFSLFLTNLYFRIVMRIYICFKNFEKCISYHILFKDGGKENNIFSFVILYRKGRVDNYRGQGHFKENNIFFRKISEFSWDRTLYL